MNILGHLIPNSAILGVGPIMLEYKPNDVFQSRRYVFVLHLTGHTTRIESDWFSPIASSSASEQGETKERMLKWKSEYNYVREKFAAQICETEVFEDFAEYREKIAKLHGDVITTLESLFADLQPTYPIPDLTNSINLRKQRVVDLLLDLKVIATK